MIFLLMLAKEPQETRGFLLRARLAALMAMAATQKAIMDITLLLHALILGVVEGLTEFLPISSTGHLILVGDLLHFNDDKGKVFEIVIQFGAILAVMWEYRAKLISVIQGLWQAQGLAARLVTNLMIAFIPVACIRPAVCQKHQGTTVFEPIPVALAFIIGGFIILWAEKRPHVVRVATADDLSPLTHSRSAWRNAWH